MRDPMAMTASAIRWWPRSLLLLAGGACALTWNTPYFQLMVSWSLPIALAALTLMAARPLPGGLPRRVSPAGFASVALALNAAALLLLIPVVVLVTKNAADSIPGWTYPFLNKRWLSALYGVGLVIVFVVPTALRRLFPPEPAAAEVVETPHRLLRVVGIGVVIAFAWFVAGPPWNVERHHRPIDFHEQVHLGPLQAIAKGEMPFIGPAATQYGPGSQVLMYEYMTRTGRFTVVGFRETNLLFHAITLTAAGLIALWLIDLPSALLVMILALAFSAVSFFNAAADGTFDGAYGWGNALRYVGAIIVCPGAVLAAGKVRRRWFSPAHLVFGVVWGMFAWISQENLTATAAATGLSLLVILLTGTVTARQAIAVGISLAAGFALFWMPLLLIYASAGHLGEFVGNYFRVARAIVVGFQNTWWNEDASTPVYTAYRLTPWVIGGVGILTLWDVTTMRLRAPLSARQTRLLAFVSLLAATYATALYRSDNSHLINSLLPLPFVLTLAFRDLPTWTAATWLGRAIVRTAVVAVAVYVYPIAPLLTDLYGGLIKPSLVRFAPLPAPPAVNPGNGVAFDRATPYLSDEPLVAAGSVPMRQFLEEASEIHRLVGDRKTYLTGMGSVYTGLVYFMADLTPAQSLLERETMTINSLISQEQLNNYRGRVKDVECVMVREIEMDEAKIFLAAHPGARVEQRPLAGRPVFVLLAN